MKLAEDRGESALYTSLHSIMASST